jgi:hypothetical protein
MGPDEPSAGTTQDRQRRKLNPGGRTSPKKSTEKPLSGNRPVITMGIHGADTPRQVRVLLDTGCSVPLINQELCGLMKIALLRHEEKISLRNFAGEIVAGAGQFYTRPLLLQHRGHWTRETFEVAPLEPGVDLFLPFWWIERHPPQGAWNSPEFRFSGPTCLRNCTRTTASEFSLVLDESILQHSGVTDLA